MATLAVNWCEEAEEVERAGPLGASSAEDEAHYLRVHSFALMQLLLM